MKSEQLDLIQSSYKSLICEINDSFNNELNELNLVFEGMKEQVINGIRFGLFSKKRDNLKLINKKDTYPKVFDFQSQQNFHDSLIGELQINFSQLMALDKKLKENFETNHQSFVLSEKVLPFIQQKFLKIFYDYDKNETTFSVTQNLDELSYKWVDNWNIIAMLPDCDTIFGELGDNDWRWEYLSAYEDWAYKIWSKNKYEVYRAYIQLGGYGHFIQGSYEGYIAQINNEVGDCGSLYVHYNFAKNEFNGHLDMY